MNSVRPPEGGSCAVVNDRPPRQGEALPTQWASLGEILQ
jgi:hypothetical protein